MQVEFEKLSKKILVVDDDPDSISVITEMIRHDKYQVDSASSAETALEKIKTFHPDLIVTDHDMPGLSGLEMLRTLRHEDNYVALIFLSGKGQTDVIVQALKAGADDFIRKPVRSEELLARIESSLRTHELSRRLMEANSQLQEMVDRDYLTGLFNMRSVYAKIDTEIKRARRHKRNLSCVMIDMDYFKKVNDEFDHLFGSFVLKEMGRIIQESQRESDFAARYGGDEFLLCLTEADEAGTVGFCKRLREKVIAHTFEDEDNSIQLTISIGYAIFHPEQWEMDARALVREADHALYRAKHAGRNRISN